MWNATSKSGKDKDKACECFEMRMNVSKCVYAHNERDHFRQQLALRKINFVITLRLSIKSSSTRRQHDLSSVMISERVLYSVFVEDPCFFQKRYKDKL